MNDTFRLEPLGEREIVIARAFRTPVARLFEAWTSPTLVQRWLLGPEGWTMPVCEIDLRVGGAIHYTWRHPDGRAFGLTGVFREVEAPHRLVHTELFDENWTGGETVVSTLFSEADAGKDDAITHVRTTIRYASREARDGAIRTGMEQGIAASYERLDGMVDGTAGLSTPRLVDVAAKLAAVVRASVPLAEMPAAQRAARARLATLAGRADLEPLGARLTIWRPPADGTMDYAPGILIPRAFDPPDGISVTELPTGRAAHLRLTGPYSDLPKAWRHLFTACRAQGWTPAGFNWEIYGADESAEETELYTLLS